jgi:hypothetical protein
MRIPSVNALFEEYCKHHPKNVSDVFYLVPLPNPKGMVWYKNQAIGVHTLSGTVERLWSNHSLRVTQQQRGYFRGEPMNNLLWSELDIDVQMGFKFTEQQAMLSNREKPPEKLLSAGKDLLLPPSVFLLHSIRRKGEPSTFKNE